MGRRHTVNTSPHLEEIRELFLSGWSPYYVRAYLVAQYGDGPAVPSLFALKRYRARHIPSTALIPPSLVRQALGGRRYRVDIINLLDELIWVQEQRIGWLWKREQNADRPDPRLHEAIRLIMDTAEKRHRIAAELGVEAPRALRLERNQTEVLEVPHTHVEEMLALLRQRREQLTSPDPAPTPDNTGAS